MAKSSQPNRVQAANNNISAGSTGNYIAVNPSTGEVVENLGNKLPPGISAGSKVQTKTTSGAMEGERQIDCPYCNGKVLVNNVGRLFASVNIFLERSFNIRIPTGVLEYLQSKMPIEKKTLLKGDCKACNGKGTIKDPSDDSKRWKQVATNAQSKFAKLLELENKLAPACGNRHTIIQGHELLEVGIGLNDSPSYRVDVAKGVASWGLSDMGDIDVQKGGSIPRGAQRNHVQGLNVLASPGGQYTIKCANKLSIITGSQGVEITTGGPLNISGGITKITGPELVVGTQTGKLLLEGETVNMNAKSVEVTPSDGHFFVKGTISNTGNMMCAGHGHMESASVVNLAVPGKNETTNASAPSDKQTGSAFWGGAAGEAIAPLVKDAVAHALANTTHPKLAQGAAMPRFMASMQDKMANLAYAMRPTELVPTGIIKPGTPIILSGNFPGGNGTASTVTTTPILLFNFPHTHQMPDANHLHDMRVPNIDITSDDAGGVRAKAGGASSPAPVHKTVSLASVLESTLWAPLLGAGSSLKGLLKSDRK